MPYTYTHAATPTNSAPRCSLRTVQETVSIDGTHLGHNLPDKSGNRYCINLVCVAGSPVADPVADGSLKSDL